MENVKFFGLKDYFYNKAVFGAQRKKKMKEKKLFWKKIAFDDHQVQKAKDFDG